MTGLLDFRGKNRTPYIQQSEASECALACLAMVAAFHRYETDLGTLRQRFPLSLKGATLKQLMDIAESLGFNTRPVRCEPNDLNHLALPVILHWNLNHFVVLTAITESARGSRFHINDPAQGELKLSADEVSRNFSGVALELIKSDVFKPVVDRRRLRISQLWSSMSGFWGSLGQILALSLILQLVSLAVPFYMQVSIDTVFPSFDTSLLTVLALGFAGLAVVNFATAWLRGLVLLTLNNALSYQIIVNLYRHLVRLPLPWFEKRHVGDIISRFGSTQPISDLLSQGLIAALVDGLMAMLTLGLMFLYSVKLGIVATLAFLIYLALRLAFFETIKTLRA